jgi:hypothetical protein
LAHSGQVPANWWHSDIIGLLVPSSTILLSWQSAHGACQTLRSHGILLMLRDVKILFFNPHTVRHFKIFLDTWMATLRGSLGSYLRSALFDVNNDAIRLSEQMRRLRWKPRQAWRVIQSESSRRAIMPLWACLFVRSCYNKTSIGRP